MNTHKLLHTLDAYAMSMEDALPHQTYQPEKKFRAGLLWDLRSEYEVDEQTRNQFFWGKKTNFVGNLSTIYYT